MMRLLLVAALVAAGAGAAHAQKVYVPPPPPPVLPIPVQPIPTVRALPAPAPAAPRITVTPGIPVLTIPSARPPQAVAAPQRPVQVVPPCRRPQDCPDGSVQEKARRKFAQCMAQARVNANSFDARKLEDCALGFMAPSKLADFKRCLARRETAWDCFRQAYLN